VDFLFPGVYIYVVMIDMEKQIEQYFIGELGLSERYELLKRLETDADLGNEFARYQNTQALLSFSDDVINTEESRQKYHILLLRMKKRKMYRLIRRGVGYAAVVTLLVSITHLYQVYIHDFDRRPLPETALFVPAGQRISVTLQDGTLVWLNAQSRLTYPAVFSGTERRVSVEGEAYFEVAHNKDKPFIVSTGTTEITVLGTSFNIYNYPEEGFCRISLIEGSLQVLYPLSDPNGIILKPNQEITIRHEDSNIETISNTDYFLWKNGIYSFESEELGVILKKLELYYDIDIIVNDPAVLKWRYTVKFRQRDGIDEIMSLIRKVHPFQIQKDEENNRIVIDR